MDSKEEHDADGQRNKAAVTENSDTSALQKKRARRVSFAEMTSVHFFDRDEEYNETPSTEAEKISDAAGQLGFGELLGGSKEFGGEEDGGDSDDDEMAMRRSFLRPVGSPSPGGSTLGSASSNDDDNFFGPVSANFIRPGRFSDSGASDDNRDVTMDSATFSMHFRSLARSDSGVDVQTPTGGQLFFQEKTPTNADAGSSMAITFGKKPIPKSSVLSTEASGSHNSNDMSLVGESLNKYDYEKLSPGLDALLAESRKNLLSVSVSDDIITSMPTVRNKSETLPSTDHGDKLVDPSVPVTQGADWTNSFDVLHGDEPAAHIALGDAMAPHGSFSNGHSLQQFSSSALEDAASRRDHYKPNRSPYLLSKDESQTVFVSSASPVKRQQIVLSSASPSKNLPAASPMIEQSFSLLSSKSTDHREIQTSIQKSISKLESLEKSAFSSAFSAKVDRSTIRSLDFLKSPNFDSLLEKSHHTSSVNEDSFFEDKLAGIHLSREKRHAFSKECHRAETLNHSSGERYMEDNLGQTMSRKSPNKLSARNLSAEQSKIRGIVASPTKVMSSGNNLKCSLFASKQHNEDILVTETESLLVEPASGNGGKAILTQNFVSSPVRMLEKRLSASPGPQSRQPEDLLPHSQSMQISDFHKGRHSTPEKNPVDVNILTATRNKDAVTRGINGELNSPFAKANGQKKMFETETEQTDNQVRKEMTGTIGNLSTPTKENKAHSTNLNVGDQTNRDISRFENNLPGGEFIVASHGSITPSSSRFYNEPRLHKEQLGFPTASPSRKEFVNNHSLRVPLPKTTELSVGLENFSSNKRSIELLLRDSQGGETTILQRSPKIQKGGSWDPQVPLYPNEGRTTVAGQERKKLTDTYSKFLEDVKVLICGSADKLNSKMIDVLEDTLLHQQRSKKYEMLCLGVMPQGKIVLEDLQLEKIAEINSLLHQVVFQRANLHLKHVKRERLSKRLQLLSSRVQEFEILRANIVPHSLETCTSNAQLNGSDDLSLSVNLKEREVVCQEKLTAMRQELEALNKEILNLTRTLQSCCKMRAEPSCSKTIALVNEHIVKRASCRFIRLDMQMWSVHSVGSSNGHHIIVLNYLGFIIQSIKIIVGPTANIATSCELIETNIIKSFPNMDACVAFTFALNAETARKYVGTKTLARETQITSSILGTLLDVIEEVQLTQMELHNLTQSSFCTPSVERLDLKLSFFNFNSGRKVTLTLDMSGLKCGIYPLEILPLEITSTVGSENCSLSAPIFDEVRGAIKSVRTGHMRILQLCRCVSQVVQAATA